MTVCSCTVGQRSKHCGRRCFAAGGTGALNKKESIMHRRLCEYEATLQDISQEVEAWLQTGLHNVQLPQEYFKVM